MCVCVHVHVCVHVCICTSVLYWQMTLTFSTTHSVNIPSIVSRSIPLRMRAKSTQWPLTCTTQTPTPFFVPINLPSHTRTHTHTSGGRPQRVFPSLPAPYSISQVPKHLLFFLTTDCTILRQNVTRYKDRVGRSNRRCDKTTLECMVTWDYSVNILWRHIDSYIMVIARKSCFNGIAWY